MGLLKNLVVGISDKGMERPGLASASDDQIYPRPGPFYAKSSVTRSSYFAL